MAEPTKKKTGKTATKKRSPAKTATKTAVKEPEKRVYTREIWAVCFLFMMIFSLIGVFNVEGWLIEFFSSIMKGLFGYGYYIFPISLFTCAWILAFHRNKPVVLRVLCVLLLPIFVGAFFQVIFSNTEASVDAGVWTYIGAMYSSGAALKSGGAIAGVLGASLRSALSIFGAVPILLFIIMLLVVIAYNTTVGRLLQYIRHQRELREEMKQMEIEEDYEQLTAPTSAPVPKAEYTTNRPVNVAVDDSEVFDVLAGKPEQKPKLLGMLMKKKDKPEPPKMAEPAPTATENVAPLSIEDAAEIAGVAVPVVDNIVTEQIIPDKKKTAAEVAEEVVNISKIIEEKTAEGDTEDYKYPPIDILRASAASVIDGREEMALNRDRLAITLKSFGVNANVVDITRGPTVTRYDIELEAGVKLAKITNLAGDLALSLGVTGVRIAPITDKISTVGIEVPNKIVSTVYLRDIIDSPNFRNAPSKISFSIGKDIADNCVVGNIAKLPHLLIAGTTGSGKSVCMNSLIISLLYKASPEEVRLIMIDPKMVELGIYNGIPHLYVPVVTDPKKAAGALQWSVVEMLKRYRLFSEVGVRDLESYNAYQRKNDGQTLPQVVIVIDELADLMLVAAKEVEESICRVAQMGRASGMHLVIATQRPSADVITGLMKANIPSRIAFAVSSSMESRIILDTMGAEKLIGMGDMLYAPLGMGKPLRVQGAFVSDDEREEIINFIKEGSQAQYSDEIIQQIEQAAEEKTAKVDLKSTSSNDAMADYDDLLPQGVDVIFETKQASVSMLQRRLKLGYARAARMVDQMEELGVVGPFEGSKPRQIIMTREQWNAIQNGGIETNEIVEQMEFSQIESSEEEI